MTARERDNHIESRVSSLETAMDGLAQDMSQLAKSVQQLAETTREDFRQFNQAISQQTERMNLSVTGLSDKVSDGRRTDWGSMAAWAAVAIALAAAWIRPLEMRDEALEDAEVRHDAADEWTRDQVMELRERAAVLESINGSRRAAN